MILMPVLGLFVLLLSVCNSHLQLPNDVDLSRPLLCSMLSLMSLMWPLFAMNENNICILNWNVCGLNCPDRRSTVHETIDATPCNIVCLHETKLAVVDPFVASYLGGQRLKKALLSALPMAPKVVSSCFGMLIPSKLNASPLEPYLSLL